MFSASSSLSSLPYPEYSLSFCKKEVSTGFEHFSDFLTVVSKYRVTNCKLFQIYGRVQSSYLICNCLISVRGFNVKLSLDSLSKLFAEISLNASFLDAYFQNFFLQCEQVKLDIRSAVILQNKVVFSVVQISDESLFLSFFFWNLWSFLFTLHFLTCTLFN